MEPPSCIWGWASTLPTHGRNYPYKSGDGGGGSATVDLIGNAGDSVRVNFKNYCTEGSKINGYYRMSGLSDNNNANYTFEANYTVTSPSGETYNINETCNQNRCFNDVAGRDGRSYRTQNTYVDSNYDGSYSVNAKVYDGDSGYISYTVSNLVLCESGGGFQSGTIQIKDGSGTNAVRVDFNDCSSFTVSYGGASYTVSY